MGLPLGDIKDVFTAGNDAVKKRKEPVRIALFVEQGVSEQLVGVIKSCITPQLSTGMIHVEKFERAYEPQLNTLTDSVLIVASDHSPEGASLYQRALSHDLKAALICAHCDLFYETCNASHMLPAHSDIISGNTEADLTSSLASWMLANNKQKSLALAANFPFVRSELAHQIVQETAKQNAIVGGVVIIPGADMPVMTANQAKMILQIAAAYGQELGPERIKELIFAVGSGFAMRTAARQVIGIVPALGWAIKAGIGYTGTVAMGKAVISYFEQGASITGLAQQVYQLSADFASKVSEASTEAQGKEDVSNRLKDAQARAVGSVKGAAFRIKDKVHAVSSNLQSRVGKGVKKEKSSVSPASVVQAEDVLVTASGTDSPSGSVRTSSTESIPYKPGVSDSDENRHIVIEPLIVDPQK